MSILIVPLIFFVLTISQSFSLNFDNDKGYTNLIVELPSTSNHNNDLLKGFFREFNVELYKATQKKLKISEIVFIYSENNGKNAFVESKSVSWETFQKADIKITNINSKIEVHQTAFCGESGHYIRLPYDLITSKSDSIKQLIQNWIKYDFGVYDEIPRSVENACYFQNENWRLTGCYDQMPVEEIGVELDTNGLPKCDIPENLEELFSKNSNPLTSSLMFTTTIPNVSEFCEDSNHISEAPTTHNVFCQGRSIWNVISSSRKPEIFDNLGELTFTSVPSQRPRFVFIVQQLDSETNIQTISRSLEFLVRYILPDSTEIAIISFDGKCESKIDIELTKLTGVFEEREKVLNVFQLNMDTKNNYCVQNAVLSSVEILTKTKDDENIYDDTIVLMGKESDIAKNVEKIESEIKKTTKKIRLSSILFINDGEDLSKFYDFLKSREGLLFALPYDEEIVSSWNELRQGLLAITNQPKTYVVYDVSNAELDGSFRTEPGIEGKLIFHATCDNKNTLLKKKEASFNNNKFDSNVEMNAFTYVELINNTHNLNKAIWSYSIKIPIENCRPIVMAFFMPTLAAVSKTKNIEISTRPHKLFGGDLHIIYAEVTLNGKPIEAEVKIEAIGIPNRNEIIDLHLRDDGNGDPDFLAKDGFFTGYFFRKDVDSQTIYSLKMTTTFNTAGGSINSVYQSIGILPFKSDKTSSKDIEPSRITNLIVTEVTKDSIVLEWLAAGAHLNQGEAQSYDVRYSEIYRNLIEFFDEAIELEPTNKIDVKPAGELIRAEFGSPSITNSHFHIAIKAVNENNIKGLISNVVQVILEVPKKEKPTSSTEKSTTPIETTTENANKPNSTNIIIESVDYYSKRTITIVFASSFGVFVFLTIVINLIVCCWIFERHNGKNSLRNWLPTRISPVVRKSFQKHNFEEIDCKITQSKTDGQAQASTPSVARKNTPLDTFRAPYHVVNPNLIISPPISSGLVHGEDFVAHIDGIARSSIHFKGPESEISVENEGELKFINEYDQGETIKSKTKNRKEAPIYSSINRGGKNKTNNGNAKAIHQIDQGHLNESFDI